MPREGLAAFGARGLWHEAPCFAREAPCFAAVRGSTHPHASARPPWFSVVGSLRGPPAGGRQGSTCTDAQAERSAWEGEWVVLVP